MASDKIFMTFVIVVSTVLYRVLDYQNSMLEREILRFSGPATCSVNSDKDFAMMVEIGNETFLKMLRNVYVNYEDHRGNAVEKYIVNRLKKEGDEFWINRIFYRTMKCEEADLKNEFYIKLLKEMQKQKLTGRYSEDEVEDNINRLEQLYAKRIQGPSSSIIEETIIEAAPKYTSSYKLQFLETFRADMNEFSKFGKYVDALWKDLSTLCINYEFNNVNKAAFYVELCWILSHKK
ncbi:uncharacterized protein LOC122856151 [Aphidius gifuensis]|uniref:uncharacterized protein LOC122856151 n=1 Tax=Aphidius gifuensis TaxID=684658 RepID=UPI001CDC442E|nr:uncharacterized protein LOC122856151 [Aphidius gifuensis]